MRQWTCSDCGREWFSAVDQTASPCGACAGGLVARDRGPVALPDEPESSTPDSD